MMLEDALTYHTSKCETVGWLLKKDKDEIILTDTMSEEGVLSSLAIPRKWIESIEEI